MPAAHWTRARSTPTRCASACPWHGSVFRLEDGEVDHGPASVPATAYDVRSESGRIEVRASG